MTIKAIIHDWDDTITNSFQTYTQFYFDLGKFHNLEDPKIEDIKNHWGGTIVDIVSGIWPHLTSKEAEEKLNSFIEAVRSAHPYKAIVFPQVKDTILKLDTMGIKLGVISSGDSHHIKHLYREQINETLMPHCFIYDSKDLGYKKPDARVFDKAFEYFGRLGIEEHEIIYVGDAFQDYHAAKNRNMTFYAVTTGLKTKSDFIKEGLLPKYILKSFNELLSLFNDK